MADINPLAPGLPLAIDPEVGGPPTAPIGGIPPRAGRPIARFGRLGPNLVLILCAVFFLAPLLALARYALQNVPTILLGRSTLFKKWSLGGLTKAFSDKQFGPTLTLSLKLAVGTVFLTLALLLPTAIWVHMRLPKMRAVIEFVTVLPYVIPAIALVAGIVVVKPHARWFLDSNYSLVPFYVILALPFTYRSIDAGLRAIDLKTLVDASRSLGAGWGTTLRRALVPNLRTAIISSAFLTTAVVLGEFTIASTLLKNTLPTFQAIYVKREPQGGYGLNLLALVVTTGLFALLTLLTRKRGSRKSTAVVAVAATAGQARTLAP
ncbi:MAG: binding-protein-dependent transporter inner rane component [Acidimicrobiales bacterium]|nr:binding-protein-dependent transporter inner rane component [Acidimicrobiales bacterium]